jgi:hypothetical protein
MNGGGKAEKLIEVSTRAKENGHDLRHPAGMRVADKVALNPGKPNRRAEAARKL